MTRLAQIQTNFTSGELDPLVRGRVDLQQYYNGMETLTNVVVQPQGGVSRREGTKYIFTVPSSQSPQSGLRIVPFEFSETQTYILIFVHQRLYIFQNQQQVTNINSSGLDYLATGYTSATLADKFGFTQSHDTLVVFTVTGIESFVRGGSNSTWTRNSNVLTGSPFVRSGTAATDGNTTATPSASSGNITITAGASFFISDHVNQQFESTDGFGTARITKYISNTVVEAVTQTSFFDTSAMTSGTWRVNTGFDSRLQNADGGASCGTFHEGRLFVGGNGTNPNVIFGSKVGDFFNFTQSDGLDDDAIQAEISTDQVNEITAIRSGRDLQIFTTGAEYFVPQPDTSPLTPSNFVVKQATRQGSKTDINPVGSETGTYFVARGGKGIRELTYSDQETTYAVANISLLCSHLVNTPTRMGYKVSRSSTEGDRLFLINSDGSMANFTLLRGQSVVAASKFTTSGEFVDIAVDNDDVYLITKRTINSATVYYLEVFDENRTTDAGLQYFSGATSPDQSKPSDTEHGSLTHLEGATVDVIRDDNVLAQKTVSSGVINTDIVPTTYTEVGLPYTVTMKTMPFEPRLSSGNVQAQRRRIVSATPIMYNTQNLTINSKDVPFRSFPLTLGAGVANFTGEKKVGPILGFSRNPALTIGQSAPLFFTLLALEYKVSLGQ